MKFQLVLIFAVVGVAVANTNWKEHVERINKRKTECLQKYPVEENILAEFETTGVIPDDYQIKCVNFCFYHAEGYLDDKGIVIQEFTRKNIPIGENAKKLGEALDKCLGVQSLDDPCLNFDALHKCYFAQRPDRFGGFQTYNKEQ